MHIAEMLLMNVIFLVSSVVILLFLGHPKTGGPGERKLRKLLLAGFVMFQGARWLPFALALYGRIFVR